jgi:hypothetical protein
MTGNAGGPMPLAKPARWSHAAGKRQNTRRLEHPLCLKRHHQRGARGSLEANTGPAKTR